MNEHVEIQNDETENHVPVYDFRPKIQPKPSAAAQYAQATLTANVELIRIVEKEIHELTELVKEINEYIHMLRERQRVMSLSLEDMADFVSQTESFTEITRDNVISFIRPRINRD